ncbi:MAG: hypothetical protein PHF37_09190 [Phycisphaerae bacterium]|nr:hypothetical protein [Phycisphaerae bacterium]
MTSTIEYIGKGQFRNQLDSFYVVKKECNGNKETFQISQRQSGSSDKSWKFEPMKFMVDKSTQKVYGSDNEFLRWEQINNSCASFLEKIDPDQVIDKTWKQTVPLGKSDKCLGDNLTFTVTAMRLENTKMGNLVAVRALSEPAVSNESADNTISKVNAVYVFDADVENVVFSVTVFESTTNMNGLREVLRNEITTYLTTPSGKPVDLSELGNEFTNFVSQVSLTDKKLEVKEPCEFSNWARNIAFNAAQTANICASIVCEGAVNPVSAVSLPAARALEAQKNSDKGLLAASQDGNAFQQLKSNWGWNLPTVGVIGGVVGGGIAIGGGFGGGGGGSSTAVSP